MSWKINKDHEPCQCLLNIGIHLFNSGECTSNVAKTEVSDLWPKMNQSTMLGDEDYTYTINFSFVFLCAICHMAMWWLRNISILLK